MARGNRAVRRPFYRAITAKANHRDRPMPFLLGAATAVVTLLGMLGGQIDLGLEAGGVLLASAVLMTVRIE